MKQPCALAADAGLSDDYGLIANADPVGRRDLILVFPR